MKQFLSVFALFIQLTVSAQDTVQHLPFTSNSTPAVAEWKVTVQDQKLRFDWKIDNNLSVDLIEVEQSTDGKNFAMAALVFGTDTESNNQYTFPGKKPEQKTWYRLKVVAKDKKTSYTEPVTAG